MRWSQLSNKHRKTVKFLVACFIVLLLCAGAFDLSRFPSKTEGEIEDAWREYNDPTPDISDRTVKP